MPGNIDVAMITPRIPDLKRKFSREIAAKMPRNRAKTVVVPATIREFSRAWPNMVEPSNTVA